MIIVRFQYLTEGRIVQWKKKDSWLLPISLVIRPTLKAQSLNKSRTACAIYFNCWWSKPNLRYRLIKSWVSGLSILLSYFHGNQNIQDHSMAIQLNHHDDPGYRSPGTGSIALSSSNFTGSWVGSFNRTPTHEPFKNCSTGEEDETWSFAFYSHTITCPSDLRVRPGGHAMDPHRNPWGSCSWRCPQTSRRR